MKAPQLRPTHLVNAVKGWFGSRRRRSPEPALGHFRRQRIRPLVKYFSYALLAVACFVYGGAFALFAPHQLVLFLAPLAIVAALIVWALPAGDYAPTNLLRYLFFAFFAALVLWPNYLALSLPGMPWITLLRLTGMPLAFTFLICLSVSKIFREALLTTLRVDPWIWRAVALFVIIQFVSIVFSQDKGFSLNRLIVSQVNCTIVFLSSCIVFSKPGVAERWSKLFILFGAILCVIGVWEARLGHVVWANSIPSFLKIEDENVLRTLSGAARGSAHRVQATSGTPLGLGEILGMTSPFAMHLIMGRYPIAAKVFAALYVPTILQVILLADSRLGMISSLLSIAIYLFVWAVRRWRTNKGSLLAPAIALAYPALFCAGVAATFAVGRLHAMVWGNGSAQASNEGRRTQWIMGIPKILSHPWGYGIGQAAIRLGYVVPQGTLTIDSYFLSLLLDYGILGFLVFMFIFGRAAWLGLWTAQSTIEPELSLLMPAAISLLNFLVTKAVFSQEDNHPVAFMMLGAVLALTLRARRERSAMLDNRGGVLL